MTTTRPARGDTRHEDEMMSPTKIETKIEYCYPCKYHIRRMVRSGRPALYEAKCTHPDVSTGYGRNIHDSERRPSWCPIRGNAEAERDAANGGDNE